MHRIKSFIFFVFIALLAGGCNTSPGRTVPGAWGDAAIIAEQRAEIERLRGDLERMGEYQREISGRIDGITERLVSGIERSRNIENIQREIDRFVRDLIEENRKLGEIQRPDSGTDAGTR